MANPLIALMAKMPDVRGAVQENLQNQLLQQGLNQKAAEFQQAQEDRTRQQQQLTQNQELFSMAQGAQDIIPLLEAGDTIGAQKVLGRRYDDILARGGDPSDTLEAMQMIGSNDPAQIAEVKQLAEGTVREAQQRGLIKYQEPLAERFSPTTTTLDDGTTIQTTSTGRKIVTDAAGNRLEGDAASKKIIEAREFGIEEQRKRSSARVSGKGQAERIETSINEGIDAAQGIPVLQRSLTLLDEIKTGGIRAASLRAKQFFGVEGADEAELSANLGKAVLSQLRTVFGAQFTEKEGERLERIEASFGKSTEGNRRLLQQTLRLAERSANRGIEAAIEREDYRAAQDIKDLMSFNLSDDELSSRFATKETNQTKPRRKYNPETGRIE